ncbi:hypothetical protein QBC40DRAFT_287449 [Triangularia verruculosa]|uniref:Uncharacterized protein n=1 Tax=Triangularia verruculosa TaxID=2587418 RepID=A0AAN6XAC9_9PEZI|nr:hypothetical protein QBC40DRAFT_287449 [Triangularia verruculosa]
MLPLSRALACVAGLNRPTFLHLADCSGNKTRATYQRPTRQKGRAERGSQWQPLRLPIAPRPLEKGILVLHRHATTSSFSRIAFRQPENYCLGSLKRIISSRLLLVHEAHGRHDEQTQKMYQIIFVSFQQSLNMSQDSSESYSCFGPCIPQHVHARQMSVVRCKRSNVSSIAKVISEPASSMERHLISSPCRPCRGDTYRAVSKLQTEQSVLYFALANCVCTVKRGITILPTLDRSRS